MYIIIVQVIYCYLDYIKSLFGVLFGLLHMTFLSNSNANMFLALDICPIQCSL